MFGGNGTGLVLYLFSATAIVMMGVISIFQEQIETPSKTAVFPFPVASINYLGFYVNLSGSYAVTFYITL